jgi:hypothetical protein
LDEEFYPLGWNSVQYIERSKVSLQATCFLLVVYFFKPDDGGDIFLRNAG